MVFDIVIPLGPNEISNIDKQIEYTKKNIVGYRNIYIVTCNNDIKINNCITIDENVFPYKNFIADYFAQHNGKKNRNGWYFQQLIKLHAWKYIDGILDNYLIIDADVFFLKPINFIEDDKPIFSTGDEYHEPYFTHMNLLHDNFIKVHPNSGICHHMLYNKKYIIEIINIVEEKHKKPFWQVFILSVNEHKKYSNISIDESGASEYELYFNYLVKNYKDNIIIRNLKWQNVQKNANINNYLECDYISICNWMN